MDIGAWLSEAWKTSPLLAVLGALVFYFKNKVGVVSKKKDAVLTFASASYVAISFQVKRNNAESKYLAMSMKGAEDSIDAYITNLVCSYRDLIVPIIYNKNPCTCNRPSDCTMERLYIGMYETLLRDAFRSIMPKIKTIMEYNGLTTRSKASFESYYIGRTHALYIDIVKCMKREYDDHVMPIPYDSRISTVDMKVIDELGLEIFEQAREYRVLYEDKMATIEKEEIEKTTAMYGGKNG